MVGDGDVDMVEDVVSVGLAVVLRDDARVLRVAVLGNVAAHGEAASAVLLVALDGVTPRHLCKQTRFNYYEI